MMRSSSSLSFASIAPLSQALTIARDAVVMAVAFAGQLKPPHSIMIDLSQHQLRMDRTA
jgi:hypothetical protein